MTWTRLTEPETDELLLGGTFLISGRYDSHQERWDSTPILARLINYGGEYFWEIKDDETADLDWYKYGDVLFVAEFNLPVCCHCKHWNPIGKMGCRAGHRCERIDDTCEDWKEFDILSDGECALPWKRITTPERDRLESGLYAVKREGHIWLWNYSAGTNYWESNDDYSCVEYEGAGDMCLRLSDQEIREGKDYQNGRK